MASKRYDEFDAGTVSNSKILLLADPSTGQLEKVTVEQVKGYKEYVATLRQQGTNPPVATIMKNTLGGTVVWTRMGNGVYKGTLAGSFPTSKTICLFGSGEAGSGGNYQVEANDQNSNFILVTSAALYVDLSSEIVEYQPYDDQLFNFPIRIEVYP